ncbi:GNAT family N-acetyltransferase [Spiroplasma chinense]|uniref:GNAT family N-acetyltransferase n=1 Tax=Spiroplasma chinense TaxID=216932 RepID=A0A5B9Y423_9MOLU|nr:GNAT family N-acetyltransferase [Spiroplasma chinense]QEH61513.1 GNAT family N-acetyltransferase [Spiroplasma chinense]
MYSLSFQVDFGKDNEVFRKALLIREEIFVKEQKINIEDEFDEYDDESFHVIGSTKDGVVICCARIIKKNNRWYFGRIAVNLHYREVGYASKLLKFLEDYLLNTLGINTVYLDAQFPVVYFYEKMGYILIPDEEVKAVIPCRLMFKELW